MPQNDHQPPRRPVPKGAAKPWPNAASAYGVAIITLALAAGFMRALTATLLAPGPVAMPGDIVAVSTATRWSVPMQIVPAHSLSGVWSAPGAACALDIPLMAQAGGVLTVFAARPDGVLLDWSGGPTAPGHASCAAASGILVTNASFRQMQFALAPHH
jgi:hypothetical protein